MLFNTQALYHYGLAASDGVIGHLHDFYFDDHSWVIRYVVADTGSWLTGRQVLITPHAFGSIDVNEKTLHIKLSRQRIEDSPSIENHRPVSRQYEIDYYRYYGWPAYWDGGGMWGIGSFPVVTPPSREEQSASTHVHRADKHLQSALSLRGYQIRTTDGSVGHVQGFMVDDQSWTIREVVVETGHWFSGKEILLSPVNITAVNYEESTLVVSLSLADIRQTEENRVAHSHRTPHASHGFPTD